MVMARLRPDLIWNRYNFPVSMEGCVLYLPLWQEDMQGSPILSYDPYHHSCAVTGAVWGSQGRTFDGIDDYINPTSTGFPSGTSARTILLWCNPTSVASNQVLIGYGTVAVHQIFEISFSGIASGDLVLHDWGTDWHTAGGALTAGTWNYTVVGYTGIVPFFYVNGVSKSYSASGVPAPNTVLSLCEIGCRVSDHTQDYAGLIGEVWIYNRALTAGDIMRIYQYTRWRYR